MVITADEKLSHKVKSSRVRAVITSLDLLVPMICRIFSPDGTLRRV